MQHLASDSDDLSQDSPLDSEHRKPVARVGHKSYVDPASRRSKDMFDTLSMSSVGLEFGLAVIMGLLFGRWLDGKAGTDPWFMILFLLLGFVAGLRGIWRAVVKSDRLAAAEAEALRE
ncbi:MAG: AtpZ/AtpI family protein [Proteobacteria bacterium]|nr:AtpZ/AtpI family protein [Pseudomonadota bacterium]